MLIFESYEAMAAIGTWFAGLITAAAVIVSIWATSEKHSPVVSLSMIKDKGHLGITLHNEGDYAIVLNGIGGYCSGHYISLIETGPEIIQPNNNKTYSVSWEEVGSFRTDIIRSLNLDYDNPILSNNKPLIYPNDAINIKHHYSIKLATRISGKTFLTKKWISVFMLESPNEKWASPDYYYNMKKYVSHNIQDVTILIILLSPLFMLSSVLETTFHFSYLLIPMGAILYHLTIWGYTENVQTSRYQTLISIWIGAMIGLGIIGIMQLSLMSIIFSLLISSFVTIWIWEYYD